MGMLFPGGPCWRCGQPCVHGVDFIAQDVTDDLFGDKGGPLWQHTDREVCKGNLE